MSRLCAVAVVLMLPGMAGLLHGDSDRVPTLLGNSPFLPPGFQPPGQTPGQPPQTPVQSGQYEFRGVYELNDVYYFNLYNIRERKGTWLNDSGLDSGKPGGISYRIVDFDPDSDKLVLQMEGQTLNLSLAQTSDAPMPVQTAPATQTPKPQQKPEVKPRTSQTRRRVIRPTAPRRTANGQPVRRRVIRPVPKAD